MDNPRLFSRLLHAGLPGHAALLLKNQTTGRTHTSWSSPGELSLTPGQRAAPMHAWLSVCTFKSKDRHKNQALWCRALWADCDYETALQDLETFQLEPSIVVATGRAGHAQPYWLLDRPILLQHNGRPTDAACLLRGVVKTLEHELGGDSVSDLARVLRVPGTHNPKPDAGPCRVVVHQADRRYRLEDIAAALGAEPVDAWGPEATAKQKPSKCLNPATTPQGAATEPQPKRGRGRPPVSMTQRELERSKLPTWAKCLALGGPWRAGKRYRKHGGLDRSRADFAFICAALRAGYDSEWIARAYGRHDWHISDKVRHRADSAEYLEGRIRAARAAVNKAAS